MEPGLAYFSHIEHCKLSVRLLSKLFFQIRILIHHYWENLSGTCPKFFVDCEKIAATTYSFRIILIETQLTAELSQRIESDFDTNY